MVSKKRVERRVGSEDKLINVIDNRVNHVVKLVSEKLPEKRDQVFEAVRKEDLNSLKENYKEYAGTCMASKDYIIEMLKWMHKIELETVGMVDETKEKITKKSEDSKDKKVNKIYKKIIKDFASIKSNYNGALKYEAKLQRDIKRSKKKLRNMNFMQTLEHQRKVIRNTIVEVKRWLSDFEHTLDNLNKSIGSTVDEKARDYSGRLVNVCAELMKDYARIYQSFIVLLTDVREEYEKMKDRILVIPNFEKYFPSDAKGIEKEYKRFKNELERQGRYMRREALELRI